MPKRRIPGLSPNPMTNLIVTDIALRGAGRLARHFTEKALLRTRYSKDDAEKVVEGRSMAQTLAAVAVARIATRSLPGAAIVGSGILAKSLWDRSRGKRTARSEGRKQMRERMANAEKSGL
ncbi:hypothetical protein [Croceicoccus naphthovorans]|uniref:Uncharacterized protein n=1 Tax=Croceicoccus naphthovorans TaxID=1348774 RepID=A0A0G3XE58_9SPHN|nr:hypothetical protein [Croceicoccus naphthovorans]AKM09830.1 hypothetical protein AB433_07275 [Croceicoccus naphthovorans]MBB3991268.1 hypothetical protein [Croceicoccus naphthovorans]